MKTKARNEPEAGPPARIRAEAALWLARLHSDTRSELTDCSCRAWLAEDPAHAAAFERLTNTWEATGSLRRPESRRWRVNLTERKNILFL